ncbi:MAG: Cof-type HAD-IIB family hydrolase [Prevotella sp.]
MNRIEAIFSDIDGTLVSFRTHRIPPSAVTALAEAKRRGVKIFISTGRPRSFINNIGEIEHLVDGYITVNGACCEINGEILGTEHIDNEDAARMVDFIIKRHIPCVIMGIHGNCMLNATAQTDRLMVDMLNIGHECLSMALDDIMHDSILQITPFADIATERELLDGLPGYNAARWHPDFCDITSARADKGRGLLTVARHENIDVASTMALGDGGNDLPIIRRAGIGVSMGNATPDVKMAADYVTAHIDDDGMAVALRHFGVI